MSSCSSLFFNLIKLDEGGGSCGPQTSVTQETNQLSQTITNSVQSSITNDTTNVAVYQGQDVSIIGGCCPGGINISQSANVQVKTMTNISSEFVSQAMSQVENSLKNSVDQSSSLVADMLSANTSSKTTIDIKQNISRIMQSNATKTAVNNATRNLAVAQNQRVNLVCPPNFTVPSNLVGADGKCIISQNLIASLYGDTIVKACFSEIQKDAYMQELANEVKQTTKNEGKGIADIAKNIADVAKSFLGAYSMIYIVIIAAVVLFIPLIIFAFKSGGKKTTVISEGAIAQFLRSVRRR